MGSDKLVEITLDDANSVINLRDHRMLTEYTETGDLVITVFSKNELIHTPKKTQNYIAFSRFFFCCSP